MASTLEQLQQYGANKAALAEKNLSFRIQSEMKAARTASAAAREEARQARIAQGEVLKDSVHISEAARAMADNYSSDTPDANGAPALSMSAVTAFGTTVTLEGRAISSGGFVMGGLREDSARNKGLFQMSGMQKAAPEMEYTLSFVGSQGKVESYKLDGNTLFTVLDDGTIRRAPVTGDKSTLTGGEGQDILIGIEDGSILNGGGGDDIIFNAGLNSQVNGGDGDDVITSMGEGAVLDAGAGDDTITLLQDTLRPQQFEPTNPKDGDDELEPGEHGANERLRGAQSVTVRGGDGNDAIIAKTALFRSKIDGGAGSDEIELGDATSSIINMGDGSDSLVARNLYYTDVQGGGGNDSVLVNEIWHSSIDGGDGDDLIKGRVSHNSTVAGGAGNDVMIFEDAFDSVFSGGDGDDVIAVTGKKSTRNRVYGGDGNDFIYVNSASKSIISGGAGDDEIVAVYAHDSKINGDAGNDKITVGVASGSTIINGGIDEDEINVYKASEAKKAASGYVRDEDGNYTLSTDAEAGQIIADMLETMKVESVR